MSHSGSPAFRDHSVLCSAYPGVIGRIRDKSWTCDCGAEIINLIETAGRNVRLYISTLRQAKNGGSFKNGVGSIEVGRHDWEHQIKALVSRVKGPGNYEASADSRKPAMWSFRLSETEARSLGWDPNVKAVWSALPAIPKCDRAKAAAPNKPRPLSDLRSRAVAYGLLSTLSLWIKTEWGPVCAAGKISECRLMDSLRDSLVKQFPKTTLVKREYMHCGAPRDAFIKLQDSESVFVEAKLNLNSTGRYHELVGQVTGLAGNKVIILLFGSTRRDLLALIHHTFARQIEAGEITVVEKDISDRLISNVRRAFKARPNPMTIEEERVAAIELASRLHARQREEEIEAAKENESLFQTSRRDRTLPNG